MTILSVCSGNERGDLELQKNNFTKSENGKRCYSCGQNLKHYVGDYCSNGAINGIRYLSENRTIIEKIWWAISITLSLYFCVSLILNAYERWENSPVIVSFATKETPVWMFPFPAVTICPESKIKNSIFNHTYYLYKKQNNETLTEEQERKFGYTSFICDLQWDVEHKSGKFADERMLDFFEEIQPNFYENAFDCKYLGEKYNCSDLFIPMITNDGICYTFNIMDRSQILSDIVFHHKDFHKTNISYDWDVENGFNKSAGLETYPRRALISGIPFGLEVKLKTHMDDLESTCNTPLEGFKVQITHPQKIPRVKQQHFIVPLERVVKVGIEPDSMATSEDVKQYSPEQRKCFLPSGRRLKYYKIYTQNHCFLECRANFTLKKCGCVNYNMPREAEISICGAENLDCMNAAVNEMLRGQVKRQLNLLHKIKDPEDEKTPRCNCLPLCSSMYYEIESTQSVWNWRTQYKYITDSNVNISDKSISMTTLRIFFKNSQFITSQRNELYGSIEFVANIGGLLGLFVGFSALSFMEIIYYLTLRIMCNIKMFGKGNWSGKTD